MHYTHQVIIQDVVLGDEIKSVIGKERNAIAGSIGTFCDEHILFYFQVTSFLFSLSLPQSPLLITVFPRLPLSLSGPSLFIFRHIFLLSWSPGQFVILLITHTQDPPFRASFQEHNTHKSKHTFKQCYKTLHASKAWTGQLHSYPCSSSIRLQHNVFVCVLVLFQV